MIRANLVAAGAALGLTLAGIGVAAAQTDNSTTTAPPADSGSGSTTAPAPAPAPADGERGPRDGGGARHGGGGKGMGIHGEFVVPNGSGGYQTIATQRGQVTESSATKLTVKSEDGFTRSYVVNDDTQVHSANNGIADVAVGDTVSVSATVADGTATATRVHEKPAAAAAQPAN